MMIDLTESNPNKTVTYIDEISDYEPYDERFKNLKFADDMGIKVITSDDGTKLYVSVTDDIGLEGFRYCNPKEDVSLLNALNIMFGKTPDYHRAFKRITESLF